MNGKPLGKGKEKEQSAQANPDNSTAVNNLNASSNQPPINTNMFVPPPPPGYMLPPGYIPPYYQWYLHINVAIVI